MILVTINQGYSDDVMYTARAAGATGGTILKGLRCSPEEVAKHFGMALQEEQEVLAIVVPKDKKTEIMTAISKQHGIDTHQLCPAGRCNHGTVEFILYGAKTLSNHNQVR